MASVQLVSATTPENPVMYKISPICIELTSAVIVTVLREETVSIQDCKSSIGVITCWETGKDNVDWHKE